MSDKPKVGILIQTRLEDGGIYHYSEAMVYSLLETKNSDCEFVLFHSQDDKRFVSVDCEKRLLNFAKGRNKFLSYIAMVLNIRTSFLINTETKKMFSDIKALFVPNILFYPVFSLPIPFVMTIHDLQERNFPQYFSWKEKIKRAIVNRALSRVATFLICESIAIQRDLIKYLKVPSEKIKVLPENIRPTMAMNSPDSESQKLENEVNIKRAFILYPAQFWPHKNHMTLLEALANMKQPIDLICVGHKNEGLKKIQSKANELNISEYIHLMGFVSDSVLVQLYKKAELVVIPSLYESISLPIEEAKSHKQAVCCSGFLGEIHKVPAKMCFDPRSKKDMQSVIERALKSPEKCKEFVMVDKKKHWCELKNISERLLKS